MNRRTFIKKWVMGAGGVLVPKSFAQQIIPSVSRAFHITAASSSYLLEENFENASGYDTTWTESGTGTLDENASTSGLSLQGSECFNINLSTQAGRATSATYASQSEMWAYFMLRIATLPSSGTPGAFYLYNGTTSVMRITVASTGQISVRNGSAGGASCVTSLSTGTTYHIFAHYKAGSGTNGIASLSFSTDGTRKTSGNQFASQSDGNAVLSADNTVLGLVKSGAGNVTLSYYYDRVRHLSGSTPISDNP